MAVLFIAIGALLGAVANRIRGGYLTDRWRVGGQFQRLCYATIMTWLVVASGWPWPFVTWRIPAFAAALVVAWFIGAVCLGTLGAIDAGRNEGSREGDFLRNTTRGLLYALPPAALVAAVGYGCGDTGMALAAGFMLLGGVWHGLLFELAWVFRPPPKYAPTEWAEVASGAAMGAGAAAAGVFA